MGLNIIVLILGVSISPLVHAKLCSKFLGKSTEYSQRFLLRQDLEALNILSNPLENFVLSDAKLDIQISRNRSQDSSLQNVRQTITLERKSDSKLQTIRPSNYKVFDLKYVVFDSELSIMSVSKKYRNVWSTALGKELLAAKDLLEANPNYRIVLTDSGLSLWTKESLKQWLSDYTLNSMTAQSMTEFIYSNAAVELRHPTQLNSVSLSMAQRVAKELDAYKSFELENQVSDPMIPGEIKSDWLAYLYRSLFREALLEKRVEFLRTIGKKTELLDLSERDLSKALQDLSFFPEFLYEPTKASRLELQSDHMLSDGGIVFTSPQRNIALLKNLEVEFKALRALDDIKNESLSVALVVSRTDLQNRPAEEGVVDIHDFVRLQKLVHRYWEEVAAEHPNYKLTSRDLKFNFEQQEDGSTQIVILASSLLSEHGVASYLLYSLYNKMF